MNYPMLASSGGNFREGRDGKRIQYIVVHYTANNDDTARGNAQYFSRTNVTASAHFFVDENEVIQSVHEHDTAWHCGASTYKHPECRNNNSIGVELCSHKDPDGNYYFLAATVDNAAALVRELMKRYGIDVAHVLRHYDVTGKKCPAPFVENAAAWEAFKKRLTAKQEKEDTLSYTEFKAHMDRYLAERAAMPPGDWSKDSRAWAEQNGIVATNPPKYKSNITREEVVEMMYRDRVK